MILVLLRNYGIMKENTVSYGIIIIRYHNHTVSYGTLPNSYHIMQWWGFLFTSVVDSWNCVTIPRHVYIHKYRDTGGWYITPNMSVCHQIYNRHTETYRIHEARPQIKHNGHLANRSFCGFRGASSTGFWTKGPPMGSGHGAPRSLWNSFSDWK